jgi:hypothetical protein
MFSATTCDVIPGITLFNTGSAIVACCWKGGMLSPHGFGGGDLQMIQVSPISSPHSVHADHPRATDSTVAGGAAREPLAVAEQAAAEQLRFDVDAFVQRWLLSPMGARLFSGIEVDDYDLRVLGGHSGDTPTALLLVRFSIRGPSTWKPKVGYAEMVVTVNLEHGSASAVLVTAPTAGPASTKLTEASRKQWSAKLFGPLSAEAAPYTLSNRALFNGNSLPYMRHPRLPWAIVL